VRKQTKFTAQQVAEIMASGPVACPRVGDLVCFVDDGVEDGTFAVRVGLVVDAYDLIHQAPRLKVIDDQGILRNDWLWLAEDRVVSRRP
jgi:hypothetical protein